MATKRFHVQDTGAGKGVFDQLGLPWAEVPRRERDPDGCAEALLSAVRKVYSLGLADAYAGTGRGFEVRKGDDGEGTLTWDLVTLVHGQGAKRVVSRPRARFRLFGDPMRGILLGLAEKVHAAALADGRADGRPGDGFLS